MTSSTNSSSQSCRKKQVAWSLSRHTTCLFLLAASLIIFYTLNTSDGKGFLPYLKAYLEGRSDEEIWTIMQAQEPVYDYYDFTKRPDQQ